MHASHVKTRKPSALAIRAYNAIRRLRPIQVGEAVKKLIGVRRFYYALEDGTIYWIDPVSNLGLFLLNDGTYEPGMDRVIRSLLKPGDKFVDVGANEGYFSIAAAKIVGATGAVYAIEPQSRMEPVIKRNARANGLESIVRIHRLGFSDKEGAKDLFLTADINTGASSFTKHWKVGNRKETIRTTTLDAFAKEQQLESIDVLKVDCEGAEIGVIAGAEGLLKTGRITHLVIEYHPHIIGKAACEELHKKVLAVGYTQQEGVGEHRVYRR